MVAVLSTVYSDYYTNKLYKFRRRPQKLGVPELVFVTLVKILSEAMAPTFAKS